MNLFFSIIFIWILPRLAFSAAPTELGDNFKYASHSNSTETFLSKLTGSLSLCILLKLNDVSLHLSLVSLKMMIKFATWETQKIQKVRHDPPASYESPTKTLRARGI